MRGANIHWRPVSVESLTPLNPKPYYCPPRPGQSPARRWKGAERIAWPGLHVVGRIEVRKQPIDFIERPVPIPAHAEVNGEIRGSFKLS